MERLLPYLNHEAKILEAKLQTEESGTKVAIIQGKLSGYRAMLEIIKNIAYTTTLYSDKTEEIPCKFDEKIQKWVCDCQDFDVVLKLKNILVNLEDDLKMFNKFAQEKIDKKKDWLFYQAEKGRDLHFVKGWWFMFNILNDWKEAIEKQHSFLLSGKTESLPFDDDYDQETEYEDWDN